MLLTLRESSMRSGIQSLPTNPNCSLRGNMVCDYCGEDKPEVEFWDDRCVSCVASEHADIIKATYDLMTRDDFWKSVHIPLPGEYDTLRELLGLEG